MKKYKLFITPEAVEEIRTISHWYDKQQKGLGKRFKSRLKEEFTKLKRNPYTRSIRYDDVRFAIPDIFPYAAHYNIEEELHTVIVQAVLAFAQESESNWKKRI